MVSPVNLVGPSYTDDTLPASCQETINWIPERVEDTDKVVFKDPPGLVTFATAGNGPIRAMRRVNGVLYAVSGSALYRVASDATATSLGTIAGTGMCQMTHNQIVGSNGELLGNQIVIVNGTEGYVYNTQTSTLSQITDPDFTAASTCTFIGQYIAFETPTGFRISDLADPTSYNALNFQVAEADPDGSVAVFEDHEELWVFGTETTEIYQPVASTDFPFQRNSGAAITRGLYAKYSVASVDNTVYWLADNKTIVAAQGYVPVRISTHAIEQELAEFTEAQLQAAFATTWIDRGHTYYALTVPAGKTYVYDASTRLWHRRKSWEIDRWRVNFVVECYGKLLAGDYAAGTIWEMDLNSRVEGDDPMIAERVTAYLQDGQNPLFLNSVELVMNTGNALQNGTVNQTDPKVELRYSDDFGRNYSNWKIRSMGTIGEYAKRIRFGPMGRFRNRVFHIRCGDPVRRELILASVNVMQGYTQ